MTREQELELIERAILDGKLHKISYAEAEEFTKNNRIVMAREQSRRNRLTASRHLRPVAAREQVAREILGA